MSIFCHERPEKEIREIIVMVRLSLCNEEKPYGAKAIRKQMEVYNVLPLPSVSKIGRVIRMEGLTFPYR